MKRYKEFKYKYVTYEDSFGRPVILALSTYGGKVVKGTAKCDTNDVYDEENGKKLAAARCNARVAKKRVRRASEQLREAKAAYDAAKDRLEKMSQYLEESIEEENQAKLDVEAILTSI